MLVFFLINALPLAKITLKIQQKINFIEDNVQKESFQQIKLETRKKKNVCCSNEIVYLTPGV